MLSPLAAYFTQASLDTLGTVDEMLGPNTLAVPEGYFKSARTGKTRGRDSVKHRQFTFAPQSYAPESPPSSSFNSGPSSNFVPVLPAPTSLPPATAYGEPSAPVLTLPPQLDYYAPEEATSSPMPEFDNVFSNMRPHGDKVPFANVYRSSLALSQEQQLNPPPPERIVPSQAKALHPPHTMYIPSPPEAMGLGGNMNVSPTTGHISTQLRRERYASTPPLAPRAFRATDHHHHRHTRGWSPSSSSPGTPASSTHPPSPPLLPLPLPNAACSGIQSYTYPPPPPPPGTVAPPASDERVLVPLGYLQSVLFPRRDPTDDMLLRRFDALRTPSSGSASSLNPSEDLHRIMDMED